MRYVRRVQLTSVVSQRRALPGRERVGRVWEKNLYLKIGLKNRSKWVWG